ncbi:MAG TPA: hypothetical protein VF192_01040 [Longimicrobiales bacterium]
MASKAKTPAQRAAATRKANAAKAKATKQGGKGARIGAARQAVRDDLMIARLAQGWTWPMVAEEAGLSVPGAKKAVAARREAAPMKLAMDPVKIVEQTMEGYVASIASFEALAVAAVHDTNWAAAVGAKKGANDARQKILALLQATGRLPQDMGQLRHLMDLRMLAQQMVAAVDGFEAAVEAGGDPAVEAARVRATFHRLIGFDEEQAVQETVEGDAEEEPEALPA